MIFENIPKFFSRISDVVFPGRNRARIVIGTDRKDTRESGYGDGGDGDVDSATIDVVAGYSPDGNNPDLVNDKSRIYISGKTKPDNYFDITKGSAVEGEAAVVIVSDNVYTKARKKTKIIGPEYSIVIDENGDAVIELKSVSMSAQGSIELKTGTNKIIINSAGITLDAGQGIEGKILTDLDIQGGPISVVGAPGTVLVRPPVALNQKITVK